MLINRQYALISVILFVVMSAEGAHRQRVSAVNNSTKSISVIAPD